MMGYSRNGIRGVRSWDNCLNCRIPSLDESASADGDKDFISVDIGYVRVLINACYCPG